MERNCRLCVSRVTFVLIILAALLLAGPASAQDEGATQGDVALYLSQMLALELPEGATAEDAINALTDMGIAPAGGWNANARADAGFIASLFSSVEAAIARGTVSPGTLGSAAAVTAAAATQAGMSRAAVVAAIVEAGGNGDDATFGATTRGTFSGEPAPGAAGGIGDDGPEKDGRGGGGGSPSPSR
ncbi:MAG TPA: hypothetical protein PLP82_11270 [Deltaproteobacteria bacterium]|uniref:hypothetical protein n=1 Tax=Aminivibrio sp. TaxID=1872489 RepID=UPI002C566EDF|nr:hypothetical protein [Deltaproteobacteria bacterium]